MAPAVRLRSAGALVARLPVLGGAHVDLEAGETVLVRGPNGAGKTSLLRACAGLLPMTSGEASVLGHDLRLDRRSVRRTVGLLAHDNHLYQDLSAEENVRFVARATGGDGDGAGPALARMGLTGRLSTVAVARLSAGQRRRVAIAALVVRRPLLWLLDEPHAGLDVEARATLDDLVRQSVADGATVLFTSHEGDTATALAGRVVTMAGGQVRPAPRREPSHVA